MSYDNVSSGGHGRECCADVILLCLSLKSFQFAAERRRLDDRPAS
jgi:hypothetical protein